MNIFSVLRASYHFWNLKGFVARMFYVKEIRGLIFTMFTHKKLEIVFVFVQRSGSGNLLMDFLAFIEQTWKENNTYFIDVLIIDNVELWNLKEFSDEAVLRREN